jgi:MFS family permease
MGLQFQSIAAVGAFLVGDLGLSYTQLGTLIGLYLLPGAFISLPGGLLGARFGDRTVTLTGLGLMTVGGVAVTLGGAWPLVAAGRLVSGSGGVLLNLQLAKVVTDAFAGRELATALGGMLAAWPLGIALGLATLGGLAEATTWRTAVSVTTVLAAIGFGLILLFLRGAPRPPAAAAEASRGWWSITGREMALTLVAGLAWAVLNAGFILFLSFGPKLLVERGATPAAANLAVSWASFLSIATVPLGGAVLDRVGRRDPVMAIGILGAAAACGGLALGGPAVLWSALVGLLVAPAAGVVALPGEALSPRSRNTGFGLFYAIYYAGMGGVPALAGYLVDRHGGAAALWLAAAAWLVTWPALGFFRALQGRWAGTRTA